ncbi:MAG: hypothetical protein HQ504_09855 [Rhodospirillaceae bacterium]|nr:hypothetical protein [Rhodospirillaceae bacterium]
MSDTPPSENEPEQFPLASDQILHLLQDCSNNIRHAKAQQWQAGYFTILAFGAHIVAAHQVVDASCALTEAWPIILAVIWSVLIFAAGAFGAVVIWDLQLWMSHLRKSMTAAEEHFSEPYRTIAGGSGGRNDYHSVFYQSLQAWLITVVIIVGWLIASFMIIVKFAAL